MGEKVVRRKHLKTANQGVDGRFSRSFFVVVVVVVFVVVVVCFFLQTVTTVWEMLSKKQ